MNTTYMYKNTYTEAIENYYNQDFENKEDPYLRYIDNGIILPCKESKNTIWGAGGLIDSEGNFVKESQIENAFGEPYEFDRDNIRLIDETVLYIPIIPNQWGHFLINTLCRFWASNEIKEYRIACCEWGWRGQSLTENYLQILDALDVTEGKLFLITEPTKFKTVIIPSSTFGYGELYSRKYIEIIDTIVHNSLNRSTLNITPIEKIYFSRMNLSSNKNNEVGEKEIERFFKDNGWTVLYPEKLSADEQIYYIHNAKHIACVGGTISHNAVFSSDYTKWVIINKTCVLNPPQIKINKLFDIDCTIIDCYTKLTKRMRLDYGFGPYAIEVNVNLLNYMKDCLGEKAVIDKQLFGTSIKIKNLLRHMFLIFARIGVGILIKAGLWEYLKKSKNH